MEKLILLGCVVTYVPLAVFAQASPDSISGGAGWVGAGLLGAVLAWLLLVYLPSKDKQLEKFIEIKDKQIAGREIEVAAMRVTFQEEMDKLRQFHDKKTTELYAMLVKLATDFRSAVHDTRDVAQVAINKATEAQIQAQARAAGDSGTSLGRKP